MRTVVISLLLLALVILAMPFARGDDLVRVLVRMAVFLGLWCLVLIVARLSPESANRVRRSLDSLVESTEAGLTPARAGIWLVCGIAIYVIVWSVLSILRHNGLNSSGWDLAIAHQTIWNLAHGRGFASSIEVSNYLGDHVGLTLPIVAPSLWIWNDVRMLLIVQSVILGLGAWPVYRIAVRHSGRRLDGLVWALVYLLTPAIGFMNKYDFHELVFALPLLLAAIDAVDAGKLWHASVWMLLSTLTREEVGLAVAALGIWTAIAMKKRAWGLTWAVVGFTWSVIALYVVIPHFREGVESDTLIRYGWLGADPGEIAKNLLTRPWILFESHYHRVRRVVFPVQLLWPMAGLPLLGLGRLILALPNLGLSITSSNIAQNSIYFQYNGPILPFVFWAAVAGYRRLLRKNYSPGLLILVVLFFLAGANVGDPAAIKNVERPYAFVHGIVPRPNCAAFQEAARRIPADADVVASNNLAAHLAARSQLTVFHLLRPNPDASWIVIDLTDTRHLESRRDVAVRVADWVAGKGYAVNFMRDGIVLLEKNGADDENARQRLAEYLAEWDLMPE